MSANHLIYYCFFFFSTIFAMTQCKIPFLSEESYHCHVRKGSSMPWELK